MTSIFFSAITKRELTSEQLVTSISQALELLSKRELVDSKIANEQHICKQLAQMKLYLYGDGKSIEINETKALELARYSIQENLLYDLIQNIELLPFEARKDTAHIYNNLIRKNLSNFVEYVNQNFIIIEHLVKGYSYTQSALNCGSMLRESIRYDTIAVQLLHSNYLWLFFDTYVHLRNFEVASDSFNTLRDLLTTPRNKSISSTFLHSNYDAVMSHYESLLTSDNFVTRWRSLKLLGDLLLDRSNFIVMIRYISSKDNLKTIMNLLRDKSPNIQFEAFHVFKVFVAYPNKPSDISLILYKNKDKLISFLENFHTDKEDAQFIEEKCLLIETLSTLTKPISSSTSSSALASTVDTATNTTTNGTDSTTNPTHSSINASGHVTDIATNGSRNNIGKSDITTVSNATTVSATTIDDERQLQETILNLHLSPSKTSYEEIETSSMKQLHRS